MWPWGENDLELTKLFVARGLNQNEDLNAVNNLGRTPLHHAVYTAAAEVVPWLLNQPNVRTDLRDKEGKTALDLAKENFRNEIIAMFREKGICV